eukprot:39988_1
MSQTVSNKVHDIIDLEIFSVIISTWYSKRNVSLRPVIAICYKYYYNFKGVLLTYRCSCTHINRNASTSTTIINTISIDSDGALYSAKNSIVDLHLMKKSCWQENEKRLLIGKLSGKQVAKLISIIIKLQINYVQNCNRKKYSIHMHHRGISIAELHGIKVKNYKKKTEITDNDIYELSLLFQFFRTNLHLHMEKKLTINDVIFSRRYDKYSYCADSNALMISLADPKCTLVFPVEMKIISSSGIRKKSEKLILNVKILRGSLNLRYNTPICAQRWNEQKMPTPVHLGRVQRITKQGKDVCIAEVNDNVVVTTQLWLQDEYIRFSKAFDIEELLVSEISRDSIDSLKINFEEWLRSNHEAIKHIHTLKKYFGII